GPSVAAARFTCAQQTSPSAGFGAQRLACLPASVPAAGGVLGGVAAGGDEDRPLEAADDLVALVLADGADGDDPLVGPRPGGPHLQHLALGVEGVAGEH